MEIALNARNIERAYWVYFPGKEMEAFFDPTALAEVMHGASKLRIVQE